MKRFLCLLAAALAGCSQPPRDSASRVVEAVPESPREEIDSSREISDLTLEEALRLASESNPGLAEAQALAEAAEGRAEQAGLWPNPELGLRMESAPFSGGTFSEAEYLAGLTQAIPLGGRLGDARRAGKLEAARLAAEARVRERALSKGVRGAFAEALYFSSAAALRERALELDDTLLRTAVARLEAGEATADEVARARLESARSTSAVRAARARRDASLVALAVAMSRPRLVIRSIQGNLETALGIPAIEELESRILSHPALAAAEADVAAREAVRDLARSQRVPDVTLEAAYRYVGSEDASAFDLGLSLSLPLLDRNQGSLRESESAVRAARARARAARASLEGDLRLAFARLGASLDTLQVVRDVLLPAAVEVDRVATARFNAGDASSTELVFARRDKVSAELEHLEALRDALAAWSEVESFRE